MCSASTSLTNMNIKPKQFTKTCKRGRNFAFILEEILLTKLSKYLHVLSIKHEVTMFKLGLKRFW